VKFDVAVRIRASADAVAAILNDADKAPLWEQNLERMEVVRGGPNEVGALARMHYVENGRAYVMEDELLECEPDRRWRSRVWGNGMQAVVETTLVEVGDETDILMVWQGGPDALLGRLLMPLLKPAIRRRARAELEALKGLVEASVA
jgi:hypothetical protein